MPVNVSAESSGPTSAKLGVNTQVGNKFSLSITNTSSSPVTVNVVVRVEIVGKGFVNEDRTDNLSIAPGATKSQNGTLFLTLAPDSTGVYKVKSTTAVEGGAGIGGPKSAVSTNWSFPVSA